MKRKIESIHGDQIKVFDQLSNHKYVRVQMNHTGFAYLDLFGIEKLQYQLELARRRIINKQGQIKKETSENNPLGLEF